MEYRKIGNSNLDASIITIGTWEYDQNLWGKISKKDIGNVLKRSVDSGINVIDSAITYRDSETIVGEAIKGYRDKVIIISKCGADPKRIPERIDFSLKRLGLEYIDLYLVHYPDVNIPIEDTMEAMEKIKDQGKARYIGVSNFNRTQLEKAVSTTDIVCCQSPYNLMWREIEEGGVVEFCKKNNIGIFTYASLGQGLFTGKIRSLDDIPKREGDIRQANLFFKEDVFKEGLKVIEILDRFSAKYNKTPAQIAINWVVNQPGITSAIVGVINLEQLNDNLGAVGWKMEEEDYKTLGSKSSDISERFDYSRSIWGGKYSEVNVEEVIDDMGLK